MLFNYLKSAYRSLLKHKLFSLINIAGLSIALIAGFLILHYVLFELSYDKFHPNADRLYRVTTVNITGGEMVYKDAMSFNLVGPTLKSEFPEVTEFARAFKLSQGINFMVGENIYREEDAFLADPAFLDLFNYPLAEGNPDKILQPYTVVLTKKAAKKYFGGEDPIGKWMQVPEGQFEGNYLVNGVIENVPDNTHLHFELLIGYGTFWQSRVEPNWTGFSDYTYIRLAKGSDVEDLQDKLYDITPNYLGEESTLVFYLQSVPDIHLHSDMAYEAEINGDAQTVYFLSVVAFIILVIAWFNYINLSTAKAVDRAKEVGLRKVVGAGRVQLIFQFLTETFIINSLAMGLAWIIASNMLPYFNVLTGKALPPFEQNNQLFIILGMMFLFSWLVTGLYPAFVQSGFNPLTVLKGKSGHHREGIQLRKVLVIFQFATSLFFIAGTSIVYMQIRHMKVRDLGMDLNQVMVVRAPIFNMQSSFIPDDSISAQYFQRFKNSVMGLSSVENVTTSASIPAGGPSNIGSMSGGIWWEENITEQQLTYYSALVDESFFDTYEIDLMEGRNFSYELDSDTLTEVIINESAMNLLGFQDPQQAIGEFLILGEERIARWEVIGVIRDFNRQSLKHEVEPTLYFYNAYQAGMYYSLQIRSEDLHNTVENLEDQWAAIFPNAPFDYFFADQKFNAQYRGDERFGKVFGLFAALAIVIACLGIYGLTFFMTIQRTKEIGIRKVLGATTGRILRLFAYELLILVIWSSLISIPAFYFIMNSWLENYAFRIGIPWWSIVLSFMLVILIVAVSVSYETIKTARLNPARTLRYE